MATCCVIHADDGVEWKYDVSTRQTAIQALVHRLPAAMRRRRKRYLCSRLRTI